jgi:hypothetical protein
MRKVARLAGVQHAEAAISLNAVPLRPDGAPRLDTATLVSTIPVASVNGLYFSQDRLAVTQGRLADPGRPDEIVMTASAAHLLGFHVGQVIPYGLYTPKQTSLPGFGTPRVPPHRRIDARLVGLVQVSNAIVQDDIDRFPTFIFFTPALGRQVPAGDSGQGTATSSTPPGPSAPRSNGLLSRWPSPWACSAQSPPWPRCSSAPRSSPASCAPPMRI